jgi:hypothetical protein
MGIKISDLQEMAGGRFVTGQRLECGLECLRFVVQMVEADIQRGAIREGIGCQVEPNPAGRLDFSAEQPQQFSPVGSAIDPAPGVHHFRPAEGPLMDLDLLILQGKKRVLAESRAEAIDINGDLAVIHATAGTLPSIVKEEPPLGGTKTPCPIGHAFLRQSRNQAGRHPIEN